MSQLKTRNVRIFDPLGDEQIVIPFKYDITSYGVDYPVDSLVKRIQNGDVYIPSFQRGYVWTYKQASRFVESLLLGLPVPGIFLSREEETEKLLVIDGQQRLRTLQWFYYGIFEKTSREFVLKGVQSEFKGLTYKNLRASDRRRLDDSVLHATIVKQDEPSEDISSIYHIFERLNTGGTRLTPQEIRAAIYHGSFNDLIRTLNTYKSWRVLFGKPHTRMRDQELILRFLALYFHRDQYERPMKTFLNKWMGGNRSLSLEVQEELTRLFTKTIDVILECLGKNAFKPKRALNAAVFDSVVIGFAKRLERGPISNPKIMRRAYSSLLRKAKFIASTEKSTSDEERVDARIDLAIRAFADVP